MNRKKRPIKYQRNIRRRLYGWMDPSGSSVCERGTWSNTPLDTKSCKVVSQPIVSGQVGALHPSIVNCVPTKVPFMHIIKTEGWFPFSFWGWIFIGIFMDSMSLRHGWRKMENRATSLWPLTFWTGYIFLSFIPSNSGCVGHVNGVC